MSKARVVVLEVTSGHLTVTEAANQYGLSRQHIYRLLARYRQGGLDWRLLEALDEVLRRARAGRCDDRDAHRTLHRIHQTDVKAWIRRRRIESHLR